MLSNTMWKILDVMRSTDVIIIFFFFVWKSYFEQLLWRQLVSRNLWTPVFISLPLNHCYKDDWCHQRWKLSSSSIIFCFLLFHVFPSVPISLCFPYSQKEKITRERCLESYERNSCTNDCCVTRSPCSDRPGCNMFNWKRWRELTDESRRERWKRRNGSYRLHINPQIL